MTSTLSLSTYDFADHLVFRSSLAFKQYLDTKQMTLDVEELLKELLQIKDTPSDSRAFEQWWYPFGADNYGLKIAQIVHAGMKFNWANDPTYRYIVMSVMDWAHHTLHTLDNLDNLDKPKRPPRLPKKTQVPKKSFKDNQFMSLGRK